MRVQDPVCGMRFEAARAAARLEWDGITYHFCSTRCLARFEIEPSRFLGSEPALSPGKEAAAPVDSPLSARVQEGRRCPYCGEKTAVAAGPGPNVGRLELSELEVIVRGEWRRRLGRDAYTRRHSLELVRALLAHALQPENAEASTAADHAIEQTLARLRKQRLSRHALWQEMTELSRAAWDVLSHSRASLETIVGLMQRIDGKLMGALQSELQRPLGLEPRRRRPRRQHT